MSTRDRILPRGIRILLIVTMTALVVLVSVLYLPDLIAVTADVLDENSALAGLLYVVVMAAGIVVLPFSSLPLLPFAAAAWGVLLGGTLSVIGWWAGALIAFVISRRLGRPVLLRLVGAERLESWEERVPGHASFVGIIIMRMVLPVEIPSYILGLTEAVRFPAYALASLIGIAPFAYVLLAMGGALAEEAWLRLGVIGVITTLAAYGLYLLFRRYRRRRG